MDKRCLQCGEMFTPKLPTKKFCSGSCRAAWSQGRANAVQQRVEVIQQQLAELSEFTDTPGMWRDEGLQGVVKAHQQFVALTHKIKPKESKS